jgi:aminoglycoside phosphotransferase (APT) family kinase protein
MGVSGVAGLPDTVLDWAIWAAPGEIVDVRPIGGGITNTKWVLQLSDGERLVLRWADPARWGSIGHEHARREALACQLLVDSDVLVPAVVASDLDGTAAGGPAILLTWRKGQSRLDPLSPAAVDALARAAVAIHRQPVPAGSRLPMRHRGSDDPQVPQWTSRPQLWRKAIEIFHSEVPATAYGLLHRDFHLGNLLWDGDIVTGVIDWAETSWGPAELDVAHICADFAMMHAVTASASFCDAYLRAGGRRDPDAFRFWSVRDVLGFLPDPAHILPAVAATRPDLNAASVRASLEEFLADTLS